MKESTENDDDDDHRAASMEASKHLLSQLAFGMHRSIVDDGHQDENEEKMTTTSRETDDGNGNIHGDTESKTATNGENRTGGLDDEVSPSGTCETESDISVSPRSNQTANDPFVTQNPSSESDIVVEKEDEKKVDGGQHQAHEQNLLPPVQENGITPPSSPAHSTRRRSSSHHRDKSIVHNFLKDPKHEMTWGRRIALFLQDKPWYNPRTAASSEESSSDEDEEDNDANKIQDGTPSLTSPDDELHDSGHESKGHVSSVSRASFNDAYPFSHATRENPSLEKAWAYFEHVALARFIVPEQKGPKTKNIFLRILHRFQKGNRPLARAEPGEQYLPTKLYRPFFTPHKQLGDWGLGVGLYFSTLRAIMLLTLAAGLLNIPSMLYFSSDDYNVDPSQDISKRLLRASAICTDTSWVLCKDCTPGQYERDRYEWGTRVGSGGEEELFVSRNNCEGVTYTTGIVSFATLLLIVAGMSAINRYLNSMEVAFDEDEQTAQDYSIVIQNPPGDATDPEEWRRFFHDGFDGAHVTVCTIAVDNDLLVRSLVERREILRKLDNMLDPGTSLNTLTLARIAAKQERERKLWGRLKAKILPGVPEFFARLVVLTAKIQGLAQQDYPSTKIFLSFETETAQRRVLNALNIGKWDVKRNHLSAVSDPKHLFRGNLVLDIEEPDEPNTVRWQDLNETAWNRMKQQSLTTLCTMVAIVVIAFIVNVCNDTSVAWAAIAISIFNTAFPVFAKILTSLEKHASEGGKQRSLYFKISLFRLVNTAVVITIITPFTTTLKNNGGLISQVYALFFAEIVTTNIIQIADPLGHIKRHFMAPRARTQDSMNMCMQGQEFHLAERYTNMTKLLFLTVWYCSIYPASFFLCSFALFVNYFIDRFSLMRSWKRAPALGSQMSKFSRRYFFPLAIVAMAILSSYYWSGFPFDNLCTLDGEVGDDLAGTWLLADDKNGTVSVDVAASDQAFGYCLQNFWKFGKERKRFPFISDFQPKGAEWMTDEQEIITRLWGWASVGVIITVTLAIFYTWVQSFRGMFKGKYEPRGDDQNINFTDVPSISGYVPQVHSAVFSYPLLACGTQDIDPELLDCIDPDRPMSYYDLTQDADVLLRGMDVSYKAVFSRVAHWPPPGSFSEQELIDDVEDDPVDGGDQKEKVVLSL